MAITNESKTQRKQEYHNTQLFYGTTSWNKISANFTTELKASKTKSALIKTVMKYVPYCWMDNRSINTARKRYSNFKSLIEEAEHKYGDVALELFKLPSEAYENIKAVENNIVREKQSLKDNYDSKEIMKVIKELKRLLISGNFAIGRNQTIETVRAYHTAIYLALVTGKRQIEILKTLHIRIRKGEPYFEGLAKKSSNEPELIKAVLLDDEVKFTQDLLKQLRKDLNVEAMSNLQINQKYNTIFNKAVKRYTGLQISFRDIREIWADICFNKFGSNSNEKVYKAEILGHMAVEVTPTDHYMTKGDNANES